MHPKRPNVERSTWLVFLFLAVAFFFIALDVTHARIGYNASPEDVASAVAEGSPARRIAFLSLAVFAIYTLLRYRSAAGQRIRGFLGWMMVAFAAWALLSPIWAEDRSQTLIRLFSFSILCLTAVAVMRRFSLRDVILWTVFTSGAYVAVGVLMEIVFKSFQPWVSGYRFAGTVHPNSQGINCALLLLSAIAAADLEQNKRMLFRICAGMGFVFLVLTASRTAFAAVLVGLAVYAALSWSHRTKIAIVYAASVVFCLLLLVLGSAFLPDLKSAVNLGRVDDSAGSLNGRTGVWDEISDYAAQRPILGYGFGGFWTPAHILEVSKEQNWGVPNSHSAYMDYLLALGAVGLTAYALILMSGILRAFRLYWITRNSAFAFCGAVLAFCMVHGFLESSTTEPSAAMFVIVMTLVYLAVRDESAMQNFYALSRGAALHASRSQSAFSSAR